MSGMDTHPHDTVTAAQSAVEQYVVITEDGLAMWAPMLRERAEALAELTTVTGLRQYAVPERVATVIGAAWAELGEASARKLDADRKARTRQLLSAYDETRAMVAGA